MPETAAAETTAEAQLGRILYILAAAREEDGIRVSALAKRMGVSAQTIRDDIAALTARELYHGGGWVAEMTILLERDRVYVVTSGEFKRPMRLTPREAGALGLALRARAAESEGDERAGLLELAQALEKALTAPPPKTHGSGSGATSRSGALPGKHWARESERPGGAALGAAAGSGSGAEKHARRRSLATAIVVDPGEGAQAGLRLLLERAIASRTPVRIRYLKPGDAAPADRVIHPYVLLAGEGGWYVVAWSLEKSGVREFRLDRVLSAELANGAFELPRDFDPTPYTQGGRPFLAHGDEEAVVRYSALVAPWVLEQGQGERCPDGSVLVRHRVADPRWLVREVLRFAGEAEVVEPAEMREKVARAADGVAEACA